MFKNMAQRGLKWPKRKFEHRAVPITLYDPKVIYLLVEMITPNSKEDFIRRHGEEAYEEKKRESKERYWNDPKGNNEECRKWREKNPDHVRANSKEQCNKGGRYYEKCRKYNSAGLRHERNRVRRKHATHYRSFKRIIAPESQLHHQWLPETADYRGVALVEANQHMHGIIDVIQILEGEITLFTEAEVSAALDPSRIPMPL